MTGVQTCALPIFYDRGKQEELVEQIKAIDPNANILWGSIDRLAKQLEDLENAREHNKSITSKELD